MPKLFSNAYSVNGSPLSLPVSIANGGTGETTAAAAINALLPTQSGHSGEYLTTDGSSASWAAASGGVTTVGSFGSSPTANAATISGSTITFQPADATHPGSITTGTQTIAGAKNFTGKLLVGSTTEGVSTTYGILAKGISSYNGTDAGNIVTIAQGVPNGGVGIAGYTDEAGLSTLNNGAGAVQLGSNGVGIFTSGVTAVGASRTWTNVAGFVRSNGDWVFGGGYDGGTSAANATNATGPFFHLNSCAGTPTGVPANSYTGKVPIIIDTTNNKFYAYYGSAWHDLTGS